MVLEEAGIRSYDACIVGGGIVGLSVGHALAETHPGISVAIVEKEPDVGFHQTGHNSGVIHSGLYYKPGSLKARLCFEGRRQLIEFVEGTSVPFRLPGKLVIARKESELPALDELERRGVANGLEGLERLGPAGIADHEPAATGVEALFVPQTGVIDFQEVARLLSSRLQAGRADVFTSWPVESIIHTTDGVVIRNGEEQIQARVLVNCGGLHSDRVASMAGVETDVSIVPFRGEYYELTPAAGSLVKTLIYPVPDPRFPFLGVHFTRRIDDRVEVGPNAVLALGREHYRGVSPDWSDVREVLGYRGFRKLAGRYLWAGMGEAIRSSSKTMYSRSAQSLVPSVGRNHLQAGGAGIRAQAVTAAGELVDDFLIEQAGSTIHVLNAPSPAATSSLAIGRYIAEIATRHLHD